MNLFLVAIIIGLGFWLVNIIGAPISFNKVRNHRKEIVKQRLMDIRTVQLAYKSMNKVYASEFDTLVDFIKNDKLPVIKVIGNPDDTTQVIRRDTTYIEVWDSLFKNRSNIIDSLPYIPFAKNKRFDLNAGSIKKGKINVQVFEAWTYYFSFLADQDGQFVDREEIIRVGSMTEATTSGNWE